MKVIKLQQCTPMAISVHFNFYYKNISSMYSYRNQENNEQVEQYKIRMKNETHNTLVTIANILNKSGIMGLK